MEFRSDMVVDMVQHIGGDSSVVAAARVSTKGSESIYDIHKDAAEMAGLIRFLMANRHGTPFEHNSVTFYIEAPIFVFREFHRHRIGWSYNETSGRYREMPPTFYQPAPERPLVQVGKPGSYTFDAGSAQQVASVRSEIRTNSTNAFYHYRKMLNDGVAKEVARMVLPLNLYSGMYATCNARSLMAFLSLRTKQESAMFKSYPQLEIEMVADQMEAVFALQFPIVWGAFCDFGRVAP